MGRQRKRRTGPTATELRLRAVHEGDKSFAIMLAPILTAMVNLIALAWCLAMIVAASRGAEGTILLLIALVPTLLLWLAAHALRRMAERYRLERAPPEVDRAC